jgi:hypothetical protein
MAQSPQRPAPKIEATKVPIGKGTGTRNHQEDLIDEALDESFPASDPPAVASPSSTLAVKRVAEQGREVPEADQACVKAEQERDAKSGKPR